MPLVKGFVMLMTRSFLPGSRQWQQEGPAASLKEAVPVLVGGCPGTRDLGAGVRGASTHLQPGSASLPLSDPWPKLRILIYKVGLTRSDRSPGSRHWLLHLPPHPTPPAPSLLLLNFSRPSPEAARSFGSTHLAPHSSHPNRSHPIPPRAQPPWAPSPPRLHASVTLTCCRCMNIPGSLSLPGLGTRCCPTLVTPLTLAPRTRVPSGCHSHPFCALWQHWSPWAGRPLVSSSVLLALCSARSRPLL